MRTQRIDLIHKYIDEQGQVTLDKLCEVFDVSKNTIRRDINTLSDNGKIKKVYGGVVSLGDKANYKELTPYTQRSTQYAKEKEAISRFAASQIENGDIVYIDTGTTSQHLLDYLGNKTCTVITNSLQISLTAIPNQNITIFSLPGKLRRETLSFVGGDAENYLKKYNINKAFMCCTGISVENGLTNASTDEYLVKKAVIENSKKRYVLADHSKFGKFTLLTYCPLNKIHHVITDTAPEENFYEYCEKQNISIYLAD